MSRALRWFIDTRCKRLRRDEIRLSGLGIPFSFMRAKRAVKATGLLIRAPGVTQDVSNITWMEDSWFAPQY